MKVGTRVRYALRLMADIAKYGHEGQVVTLKDVARRQHLSRLYLSQLTIPLKHAALLRSVWGNKGGYMLARPAAEIRLLDIVEAVDGPVCVLDCVLEPQACARTDECECLDVWRDVNERIVSALVSRTLEDVVARTPWRETANGSEHDPQFVH
jgi:Rrf2 family protein